MSTLQTQPLQTRQRLVEAAIDLLVHQGVSGTTFVDVAKHAGLSRGAVHHHYESRIELFEEVIDEIRRAMEEAVSRGLLNLDDSDRTLTTLVDFAWEQFNTREYKAYIRLRNGLSGTDRERLAQKLREATTSWMTAAAVLRTDNSPSNSELPRIVLGALFGAAATKEAMGGPAHDADYSRYLAQLKQLISLAELSVSD